MGTDSADVVETLPPPRTIKVHNLMCTELRALVDRVGRIFPDIEAARPRCSSGLQALCLLNNAIEKAKLLIQYCSESSKLYLAMTGDTILSRCKKSKSLLEQSLSQIQNMVPVMLAAEISQIISDIGTVTFRLDPTEEEAGKAVKSLLQQYKDSTNSVEKSAIERIRVAAWKLHITSQTALLIERRSIKKLLDKVGDGDLRKKQILVFLLNLLTKYGKSIVRESDSMQLEDSSSFASARDRPMRTDSPVEYGPPEEFKCPISLKLMYDPVVIASGQTYERTWIQKWFDEGNDTCPKTKRKLSHMSLTPNTSMKDLIFKWCVAHGVSIPDPRAQLASVHSWESSSTSIESLSMSMNSLRLPVDFSNVSFGSLDNSHNSVSSHVNVTNFNTDDSHRFQSRADTRDTDARLLCELESLPWESQCSVVEDVKIHLKWDDQSYELMSYESFVKPLIRFLKEAQGLCDVKAQRIGCLLLLEFLSKCRTVPDLKDDAYSLLTSFLSSEVVQEALAIMEVLSCHKRCRSEIAESGALPSLFRILETEVREFQEPAIKILCNLTLTSNIHSLIKPSEFLPRLIPFFEDVDLARYCIAILRNLCEKADARAFIAETNGCISSIARLLENDNCDDQEHALDILLSLCSQSVQYCRLVMDEGVIPAVVSISVNGNDKGKAFAMELLRLLRDINYNEYDEVQESPVADPDFSRDQSNCSKERKPSSKAPRLFGRFSVFSRSSLAPKRKV